MLSVRRMFISLVVAAAAAIPSLAVAQTKDAAKAPTKDAAKAPDVVGAASEIRVTGEITEVDKANRIVAIKGPRGRTGVFTVSEEVRNFDQIKVGDRVTVNYQAAVALALKKGGDKVREKVEAEATTRAPEGAKPGGAVAKRTTFVANVEKVDKKTAIATLRGPKGRVADVKVEDPAVLKELKAGDQVVAVIYESLAVAVTPAPAPAAKK